MRRFNWPLKTFLLDSLFFAGGSILYALGLYTFTINAGFAPGGVSGLSLIVYHYTGLPIGLVAVLFNIPLVLICLKVVGPTFLIKSVWAILWNTLFLDVVFPRFPVYAGNQLLSALFAGLCIGAGMAVIYMRGASTGGTDFLTMSIKKKRPHFSVGTITLVLDAFAILLGGIVFGNMDAVLYGVLCSFATSYTLDRLLYGSGSSKLAIIITNHGKAIAAAISTEIDRGSTLVKSTGTYTGEERDMVYCACSKRQVYKLRTAVRAVDPNSLLMITDASDVIGEGFIPPPIPGNEDDAG